MFRYIYIDKYADKERKPKEGTRKKKQGRRAAGKDRAEEKMIRNRKQLELKRN